jgi:hypothetical protein
MDFVRRPSSAKTTAASWCPAEQIRKLFGFGRPLPVATAPRIGYRFNVPANASEIAYYAWKTPTYDEIRQSIPELDMNISIALFVPDTSTELSACEPNPDRLGTNSDDAEDAVHIDLWLRDRDVVTAINAHPEGRRRTDYIRTAIRIGVLALQQAQGRIDTESVRNEGDRLIAALGARPLCLVVVDRRKPSAVS